MELPRHRLFGGIEQFSYGNFKTVRDNSLANFPRSFKVNPSEGSAVFVALMLPFLKVNLPTNYLFGMVFILLASEGLLLLGET